MKVAVIGGGAAGFFAAINVKENHPSAEVEILEKSKKLLSKVKISGGGRCNVTNGTTSLSSLAKAYPRGKNKLKKLFKEFDNQDCMRWFKSRGVPLMIQEDGCVFPVSQDSQSIIDCLVDTARHHGVVIRRDHAVEAIIPIGDQLQIRFKKDLSDVTYNKVIIATGGSPKRSGLVWLEDIGMYIADPVPSLFTFNMPSEHITKLMGIVVASARVKILGTKLLADGPLLITHWGMSGPAVLKLSAFGARILADREYKFEVQVNWVNTHDHQEVYDLLLGICSTHSKKQVNNYRPYALPERLWHYIVSKASIAPDKMWQDLGKTGIHKLTNLLCNDIYQVNGKTTFKEEFVTCGGVSWESIHTPTMSSRVHPNVYFAGEVVDVDGITGGYNFQAAWTTAYIAGRLGTTSHDSTQH